MRRHRVPDFVIASHFGTTACLSSSIAFCASGDDACSPAMSASSAPRSSSCVACTRQCRRWFSGLPRQGLSSLVRDAQARSSCSRRRASEAVAASRSEIGADCGSKTPGPPLSSSVDGLSLRGRLPGTRRSSTTCAVSWPFVVSSVLGCPRPSMRARRTWPKEQSCTTRPVSALAPAPAAA